MSSSRNNPSLRIVLCIGAMGSQWLPAAVDAKEVCPNAGRLRSADFYDGDPADLVDLMADKGNQSSGYFILSKIYDGGGFVTVRCEYENNKKVDIQLHERVSICNYKKSHSGKLSLDCRP